MQAAISGIARKAVIVDGDSLKLFDVDNPARLLDCRRADIPYIFGEGLDLRFVADTSIESVTAELKFESNFRLALDLTLISLDSELEEDIRQDALRDLEGLVRDEKVRSRLEGVMYARSLPEDSELEWVLRQDLAAPNASEFFKTLGLRQSLISDVSAAWDLIPTKVFGGDEQKLDFQRVAVQRGLFRTLVTLLEKGTNVSQFLLTAGLDVTITKLRNSREVLQQWAAPFRGAVQTPVVTRDMEEDPVAEKTPRRRHGRLVGLDRPALLRQVNEKKKIIAAAIKRRDLDFVRERVDDLVNFQRKSESEYLAKSLCDLAMEAKELGMFDLQLELTERSVGEVPADAWSWTQYGDALLKMGKFDKALYAFKQSEDFGDSVVARNGRAEVLKAQGRLADALAAFDEVIAQHPEDVVAKSSRAEVLKAQGLFIESLAAYDEIMVRYSNNEVARNGRSCVLAAMGRFEEALASLPVSEPSGFEDWIALHIRGMILMRMKRLEDAIKIFKLGVDENPFPASRPYFQTALATTLIQREQYEAAKLVLSNIEEPSLKPQITVLHLHASGEEGHDEDAMADFEDLTPKPWSVSDELLAELHRRYILKVEPKHSDEWLLDQEVSSLLLVSNQPASTAYAS